MQFFKRNEPYILILRCFLKGRLKMLKKHSRSTVGPNSYSFYFNLVSILTYLILQFFIVQKISITVLTNR